VFRRTNGNRSADLSIHGIRKAEAIWWDLNPSALIEHSLRRREGHLTDAGALVVKTGEYTGRSPNDRFFVKEPGSEGSISWGKGNLPFDAAKYDALRARMLAYLEGRELYVLNCNVGADDEYRLPIRVITEFAWQSLFSRYMFRPILDPAELSAHVPEFTVICAPGFHSRPEMDGTRSEVFILIHFGRKEVIIGGSLYAGEIKKSIFTVMNYLLPPRDVLPMHCSASWGRNNRDVSVIFGLSGTGKTTLSTDPARTLVGDDEHGWGKRGVFNFEGGCYAKVIRLSERMEPEIYRTTRMYGTILENVWMDFESRAIDLNDDHLTENTRASYPLSYIPRSCTKGAVGHPKHIMMLAADAFGVLPPISKMSPEQAMYHFLSGYTAKVAGTERGLKAPQATFSACFGAPFMARHPSVYAKLLGEKIAANKVSVWLVNTGWTGGSYGVGSRMSIDHTRAMVRAALSGKLDGVETRTDPFFGLRVPASCPDVPAEVLDPRSTWESGAAYDETARKLAAMFAENFAQYAGYVPREVLAAGMPAAGR